jgi:C1A family cysteine protease
MGYRYENRIDENGNSNGVCILPNDSIVDAWDFFRGKVATEYSYCEKMGYRTEYLKTDTEGYVTECAVCVKQLKTGGEVKIDMTALMEQNGEPLIDISQKKSTNVIYEKAKPAKALKGGSSLPSSFDWRSFNGHSYIGGVRNQGGCGSCYSFGANASAEGTYNVANGLYDANCIDLSESFIIWCLGSIPPYSDHFNGCAGADYDYMELQALCDSGVVFENSFPYVQSNPGTCTHWDDKRVKFNNWYRVDCSDTTGIKTAIMNYGVVDAAVYVSSAFDNYNKGIFSDGNTSCSSSPCYYTPTNHAIGLVGWGHDPTYGLYWILRNSWGSSWGEEGYMRIKWNAAIVSCEVCYLEYILPDKNDPTSFNASPVSASDIELAWTPNAQNDPVLVAWSTDGTFGTPVDGVEYSAVNLISGGGTVLYYGTENSFIHSSLFPSTTYYYKAWSDSSGNYSTGVDAYAKTNCSAISSFPWSEGFENGGTIPDCWSEEQVNHSGLSWKFYTGNGNSYPATAHGGTYNACLKDITTTSNLTRLVSPPLDLSEYSDATLIFWHTQLTKTTNQDSLSIYYKTSNTAEWIPLTTYKQSISSWDADTVLLSNLSSDYYICFEGNAKNGRGVCVDDVTIVPGTPAVAVTLTIADSVVSSGESVCFDATDTIYISGNGSSVEFLNGSTIDLIAGGCIRFLPDFHAHEGSYLYAWITQNASFCTSIPSVIQLPDEKSTVVADPVQNKRTNGLPDKRVKIYPNPSNGHFNVELINFEGNSTITVCNTLGAVVRRVYTVESRNTTELMLMQKGIYFVTIQNGNHISTQKMVVQ